MIFSKRCKLVEEYYKWLTEDAKDCPLNVITFLDSEGFLINAPGNAQQQVQADSALDEPIPIPVFKTMMFKLGRPTPHSLT